MPDHLATQLGNLHDVYLNASLQYSSMMNAPVERDPELFDTSRHGRFERTWLAFLYVLVESWRSTPLEPVRNLIDELVPDNRINDFLEEGQESGAISKLRDVRHYMFHRDSRLYWDRGRIAVVGNFQYNVRLYEEFGRVLLAALQGYRQLETG